MKIYFISLSSSNIVHSINYFTVIVICYMYVIKYRDISMALWTFSLLEIQIQWTISI